MIHGNLAVVLKNGMGCASIVEVTLLLENMFPCLLYEYTISSNSFITGEGTTYVNRQRGLREPNNLSVKKSAIQLLPVFIDQILAVL
jgi:hypothetical protein